MARTIDAASQQAKLNEILDCAQRLIYSTGYEEMSIQDICTRLGMSKGAFYHYFESKPALMEALLNRTSQQAVDLIFPILDDPDLPALEKLTRFYAHANNWKADQKTYLMAIFKAWYKDENAIVRQKLVANFSERFDAPLTRVFHQGIEEGVFHPIVPEMAAEVVYTLMMQMSDSCGHLLLELTTHPDALEDKIATRMDAVVRAYTDAIERVLGAKPGSIHLVDMDMLRKWFPSTLAQERVLQPGIPVEKETSL
jgi:TetR/AcrR family transcriptional regulator, transcriptional repressor for nem operon